MNFLVGFFKESDRKNIVSLWKRTFNDGEDYIDNFIERFAKRIIVCRLNDVAVGMVTVLDVFLGEHKGGYIYALAVDKKFRKQGIATQLLWFAQKTMLAENCKFSIVVPEPYDSLESFYTKLGFDRELPLYTTKIYSCDVLGSFDVKTAGKDEYCCIRNLQPSFLVHSSELFDYLYEDLILDGFQFLKVQHRDFEGFCICAIKDDCVIIKEAIPVEESVNIARYICKALDVKKSIVISNSGEQKSPFALMKCFDADFNGIYANLLLDCFGG